MLKNKTTHYETVMLQAFPLNRQKASIHINNNMTTEKEEKDRNGNQCSQCTNYLKFLFSWSEPLVHFCMNMVTKAYQNEKLN